MIKIKNDSQINLMRKAGQINALTHQLLAKHIKVGITTKELDELAETYILSNEATPSFKGYQGFPASICTSINHQVVHGIPSDYSLKDGDVLKIDLGVCYQGYHSDCAYTYIVGKGTKDTEKLLTATKEALNNGISIIKPGIYLNEVSKAIENIANKYNVSVVRELVGHGIGKNLHEDPNIPNYKTKIKGPKLKPGMTLAIEPMFNLGAPGIYMEDDNWTISTADGSPSAQFEHTVLVTENGYEILTGEW